MQRNTALRPGLVAGAIFLLAQVACIAWSRFIPERYFCWAPFDEHSHYSIAVRVDGRELGRDEIAERYRYPARGWEPRSVNNVISQVRQYESTYGAVDRAEVEIEYRVNGHPEETWRWPQR